eukprot:CAMPEP_0177632762 /NCGR_PEP_ID=MMETSP0447-20121125/2477_1 /TAXON_ID=0 /ORGANISM="Stygamoeba regulata, Strain BSH-02190019" /LENGTH=299 /DNA_ID=CAMNT_0019134377 /DNA_START=272 /DNA_END=1168 /DNA_ORIENTATION=+
MVTHAELPTVLLLIRDHFDTQLVNDPLSEQVWTESPVTEDSLLNYSRSIANEVSTMRRANAVMPRTQNAASVPTTKIVSFSKKDKAASESTFNFTREPFPTIYEEPVSLLTESIPKLRVEGPRGGSDNVIYVHLPSGHGAPLRMRLPKNITIEGVIRAAVKQHADEFRKPPLIPNLQYYQLVIADDDGTADTDLPALNSSASLGRLGPHFALQYTRGRSSTSDGFPGVMKIHLPNQQRTTVAFRADMTMGTLMNKLCQKRAMKLGEYVFRLAPLSKDSQSAPLSLDVTMGSLGVDELYL